MIKGKGESEEKIELKTSAQTEGGRDRERNESEV